MQRPVRIVAQIRVSKPRPSSLLSVVLNSLVPAQLVVKGIEATLRGTHLRQKHMGSADRPAEETWGGIAWSEAEDYSWLKVAVNHEIWGDVRGDRLYNGGRWCGNNLATLDQLGRGIGPGSTIHRRGGHTQEPDLRDPGIAEIRDRALAQAPMGVVWQLGGGIDGKLFSAPTSLITGNDAQALSPSDYSAR